MVRSSAHAVVIGAGIGGLAAAAGLQQAGWQVTVCERAAALEPVGAGLGVSPNGLRALDVLGAGDEIRRLAVAQEAGVRRRDGRWLARGVGNLVVARFGDPVVLLTRAAVSCMRSGRLVRFCASVGLRANTNNCRVSTAARSERSTMCRRNSRTGAATSGSRRPRAA